MEKAVAETCFHCGEPVRIPFLYNNKTFCCNGCQSVFRIISENGLDFVYQDGVNLSRPEDDKTEAYEFLKHPEIAESFILFKDAGVAHIKLKLPAIHCSSCVWLLENLHQVDSRIGQVEVDMMRREAKIVFDHNNISLYELAILLSRIGYPPSFNKNSEEVKANDSRFYAKLGIAGFCFGNIMLFSFPEYLNFDDEYVRDYRGFFSVLILLLSLPVLLYSARDYLQAAYMAIKTRILTLDVSIALGITALYGKSVFDIIYGNGPGYMDSFAAFVFLLLVGKWFQNKTYDHLSFDNKLESYFPLVVMRQNGSEIEMIKLDEIKADDRLMFKNNDVLPVDGIALESTTIDYSFVTGESEIVEIAEGEVLYAGGRIVGKNVLIKVNAQFNSGRLKDIWRSEKRKEVNPVEKGIRVFSGYFLKSVVAIALISGVIWAFIDPSQAMFVATSVLIVACPCALALSLPFTVGNASRLLGKHFLYVKDASTIPTLGNTNVIVFDKTGTLTVKQTGAFSTGNLPEEVVNQIYSASSMSGHPKSQAIAQMLKAYDPEMIPSDTFTENVGNGTESKFGNDTIKIGSEQFVTGTNSGSGKTYVSRNNIVLFTYDPESIVREGLEQTIEKLGDKYELYMLSGDNEQDRELILSLGFKPENIRFNQSLNDKKEFVAELKTQNKSVLMIGDGLNDVGALNQADFGIAVSDNVYGFIPKCDAILESKGINNIIQYIRVGTRSSRILKLCFTISILYNLIGLYFAISGQLSPLIAAVLMPISSVSIVLITTILLRKF